eukprot:gene7225-8607_t
MNAGKMVISETWQDNLKGGRKRLAGERDDLGSDDDDKASVMTRTTQAQ